MNHFRSNRLSTNRIFYTTISTVSIQTFSVFELVIALYIYLCLLSNQRRYAEELLNVARTLLNILLGEMISFLPQNKRTSIPAHAQCFILTAKLCFKVSNRIQIYRTYFFRRLLVNPTYYHLGDSSTAGVQVKACFYYCFR